MTRCKLCVIPDTRPDTEFVDGVCSACITHAKSVAVDWAARKQELIDLLDRHHGECIVPSSGGKDSTYQAITLKELGADVTCVTATTCMLTDMGRKNIDNLSRFCRTIEYSPDKTVRAKLNRLGLTLVGDISWPEHVAIFTTPFKAALDLGIPLMFYGENPQAHYGGPLGSEEARVMTRRWVSEFGGFLGLRASDMVGKLGITARDMQDYTLPKDIGTVEAHFLGQYLPWKSHLNARVAKNHGMLTRLPTKANWWDFENLDNAMTGIHDYMMFKKYGYGRGAAQISVDIRNLLVTREEALQWVEDNDGAFPHDYMGVPLGRVLQRIGMDHSEFMATVEKFSK